MYSSHGSNERTVTHSTYSTHSITSTYSTTITHITHITHSTHSHTGTPPTTGTPPVRAIVLGPRGIKYFAINISNLSNCHI